MIRKQTKKVWGPCRRGGRPSPPHTHDGAGREVLFGRHRCNRAESNRSKQLPHTSCVAGWLAGGYTTQTEITPDFLDNVLTAPCTSTQHSVHKLSCTDGRALSLYPSDIIRKRRSYTLIPSSAAETFLPFLRMGDIWRAPSQTLCVAGARRHGSVLWRHIFLAWLGEQPSSTQNYALLAQEYTSLNHDIYF